MPVHRPYPKPIEASTPDVSDHHGWDSEIIDIIGPQKTNGSSLSIPTPDDIEDTSSGIVASTNRNRYNYNINFDWHTANDNNRFIFDNFSTGQLSCRWFTTLVPNAYNIDITRGEPIVPSQGWAGHRWTEPQSKSAVFVDASQNIRNGLAVKIEYLVTPAEPYGMLSHANLGSRFTTATAYTNPPSNQEYVGGVYGRIIIWTNKRLIEPSYFDEVYTLYSASKFLDRYRSGSSTHIRDLGEYTSD